MSKNGNGTNGATPGNTWAGAGRRKDGKIRVAIVGVVGRELGALGLRAGGHVLAVDVQPRGRPGAR